MRNCNVFSLDDAHHISHHVVKPCDDRAYGQEISKQDVNTQEIKQEYVFTKTL